MRNVIVLCIVWLCIGVFNNVYSQNPQVDQSAREWLQIPAENINQYTGTKIANDEASLEQEVLFFINNELIEGNNVNNALLSIISSKHKMGYSFSYRQAYKGLEIYGTEIKVNVSPDFKILSTFNKSLNTSKWSVQPVEFNKYKLDGLRFQKEVIVFDGSKPIHAMLYDYHDKESNNYYEELVSENFNLILNIGHYKSAKDSMAYLYVYNPDPITVAKVQYGAPYSNNNDSDTKELTAARSIVKMRVKYLSDSFWLENKYINLVGNPPNGDVPGTRKDTFNFTRSQNEFEFVNCYYHITTYQEYIQSLGFNDLANYKLSVYPRGFADDNSRFIPDYTSEGKGRLEFGYSTDVYQHVDDAEDADVIIHEYGHAISFSANRNKNFGNARDALDEGLSDYLACSYSKSISDYQHEKLFNWDFEAFSDMRYCYTDMQYPNDYNSNTSKYKRGELWAGCLMEAQDLLGREVVDALLFNTLYSLSENITFPQAAMLMLQADSIINKKTNTNTLCSIFKTHGLIYQCATSIDEAQLLNPKWYQVNTVDFFERGNLTVNWQIDDLISIQLIDINGRVIFDENVSSRTFNRDLSHLQPGVYLLKLQTQAGYVGERLIKN